MFSGKTEELIRRLKRVKIANLKVEIFKPAIDTRYEPGLFRRTDWKLPDGSHPEPGLMLITCPDCGKTIPVSPTALEELPQNPLHSAENR